MQAEGAGAIVLEDFDSACARGAEIHGEILAATSACYSFPHGAADRQQALAVAMEDALRRAELSPERIGHIHAHGLASRRSDIDEAQAIRGVFGRSAGRTPVVAAKSHLGNAGAASGAIELVASLLALRHDRLFPIRGFESPDPDCPILPLAEHDAPAGDCFLNLNVTRQGLASCVAVARCA
jgi:3-oxoacyl-[acyl-carrier-protein] synthase II